MRWALGHRLFVVGGRFACEGDLYFEPSLIPHLGLLRKDFKQEYTLGKNVLKPRRTTLVSATFRPIPEGPDRHITYRVTAMYEGSTKDRANAQKERLRKVP